MSSFALTSQYRGISTSQQQRRQKDAKNDAKTIQNGPKTIQNDLKIARKCSENFTFSDGPIASDCFEIFGCIWNLIL